jgi:hypothetical protein
MLAKTRSNGLELSHLNAKNVLALGGITGHNNTTLWYVLYMVEQKNKNEKNDDDDDDARCRPHCAVSGH